MSTCILPSTSTRTVRPLLPGQPAEPQPAAAIDRALVDRFNHGDEQAFVEIMHRHHDKILHTTFALLRNHADAEEITQDTFLRAHRGLATFRGDSSVGTWLYRIAVNLSRNRYWYFFRRRRQDSLSLDGALGAGTAMTFSDLIADPALDPAQEAVVGEFAISVAGSMKSLPRHQREVLRLRNVLDRSYDEISQTLDISMGTVKSRIARARENLRQGVEQHGTPADHGTGPAEWFLAAQATYRRPGIARA